MATNNKISTGQKSIKHEIISSDNSKMIITVAVAAFLVVFCLFGSKSLFSQSGYHRRVIKEKRAALDQLLENLDSLNSLKQSYVAFQSESQNILGGNPSGDGPLDGSNSNIVLDSLPDKYDYPALSSSFEKILKDGGYNIEGIGGAEDIALTNNDQPTGTVLPIPVLYGFSFSSSLDGTKKLLITLENSIRPMYIDSLEIQSGDGTLQTQISLHTFFTQPKTFELGTKVVE